MADRTTVDEHVNNIWSELDLIIKKDPEFAKRFIDRFSPPEYIRQQLRRLDLHLDDEKIIEIDPV